MWRNACLHLSCKTDSSIQCNLFPRIISFFANGGHHQKNGHAMSNVNGQKCLSLLQQNYQECLDLESPITFAQINHHCGCFRETNLLLIFVPLTLSLDYWFQLFQAEKEARYWILFKGNLRNRDIYVTAIGIADQKIKF